MIEGHRLDSEISQWADSLWVALQATLEHQRREDFGALKSAKDVCEAYRVARGDVSLSSFRKNEAESELPAEEI